MEILALAKDFSKIGYIRYINLQWRRRYYSFGEYSIQIPAREYIPGVAFFFTKDRPELAVVHNITMQCTSTGDFVQISGYFSEYLLNDSIIYPRYRKSGKPESIARDVIEKFKEDLPVDLGDLQGIGVSTAMQSTGDEVGKRLYELLKTQEQSYRIHFNWDTERLVFEVWQGKDRTQNQNINPWVTFSDGFRNMRDTVAVLDTSNYKNYAVVVGNGAYEDGNQIVRIVDRSGNGHKCKIYINKTDMLYDPEQQTLEEYNESLTQAGEVELDKRSIVNSVDFEPDISRLKYMSDYDLGDKCDVIIEKLGRSYETRITEIYEVWKNGQHTISLTFGEVMPTIYEKARLK